MLFPRLSAIFLALLATACAAPAAPPTPADSVVYLIRRDWHTDIGIPTAEITGPLTALENPYPGVSMLLFGFGERQFLIDGRKDFGAMLKALLPSRSAILLTALKAPPQAAFGAANVVVLPISRAGLNRIEASIWQELQRKPVRLAEGPYPGSDFYAAEDTYFGLYTCNTWTAEVLRTGGLPMPVTGVLFSGQVMGMARWIGARHAASR